MMEQVRSMRDTMQCIRKMPLFRQVVPQEAGIGWPIPVRKAGMVYVTFPFFGYQKEQQHTALFPPFATLTLNWTNLLPVEYVDLRFRNPWPEGDWEAQADVFPYVAIAHLSVGEYQQKREDLLALYDEMLEILARGSPFSASWTATFQQLLRLLMEPGMEPFYRVLAPKFFDHFLSKI